MERILRVPGEEVYISPDVTLLILHVGDGTVRFAVKTPMDTPIMGAPGEVINDHLRPDVSKDPS
jgi:sRNA-binding carbon storage regulator CsrA